MKKILLLSFLSVSLSFHAQTPCSDGFAGPYPCNHIDLQAFMPLADLNFASNTNDIWGWVSPNTGREYALVGCDHGTVFVDITNPTQPFNVGRLATHTTGSLWRDLEAYQNYCFIGSEAPGHGIQIFDLLQLDGITEFPATFEETAHYAGVGRSHTLNIDQATGFMYIMGSDTYSGGLHIVDVNDPLNPTLLGGFSEDGYTHDGYALVYNGPDADWLGKEVVVACNDDALTIVDVDDKTDCQYISTLVYPNLGYVHQGWFTKDFRYFLMDDELDEMDFDQNTRTHIFDLVDLDAPVYMGFYEHNSPSIDHNIYVLDQFVYESNYRSGVRVLDAILVEDAELSEIAYFDLFPNNDFAVFSGTWSNYPYLPSGNVIATSMYDGFFILKPTMVILPEDTITVCNSGTFDITVNANLHFPLSIAVEGVGVDFNGSGPIITGPGTYPVSLTGSWNEQVATLHLQSTSGNDYEFPITLAACNTSGIVEPFAVGLIVSPNPANEEITIKGIDPHSNISIYDAMGRLVVQKNAVGQVQISISVRELASGIYTLTSGKESVKFERL